MSRKARSNCKLLLDRNLKGLEHLVAEIFKASRDTLVIFQLSHAGHLNDPRFQPHMCVYAPASAPVKVMNTAEMEQAREEFVAAVVRAWNLEAESWAASALPGRRRSWRTCPSR